MVVVTRVAPGMSGLGYLDHSSPSLVYPPNVNRVADAKAATRGWVNITPISGLHGHQGLGEFSMSSIPSWVLWGAGGLAAGGLAGYFLWRKKR